MEYHEDVFYDNDDNEIEVEVVFEKEYQPEEKDIGISSGYVAYFVEAKTLHKEHQSKWDKLTLEDKVWYRTKWMENIQDKL